MPRKALLQRSKEGIIALGFISLGLAAAFAAEPPASKPAQTEKMEAAVQPSSETAKAEVMTIHDVYNGTGLRDPFVSLLGRGGAGMSETDSDNPPNIHNLVLKGILSGGKERLALLEDSSTGARYVLKADSILYNVKGKPMSGISGEIKSPKSVLITTIADKDVQLLRMGESSSK